MENNFSIFVPIDTLEKGKDKDGKEVMIIGGVVSDELTGPDLDGEVIEIEGMDLTKFMSKGFVNYNHLASKDPSMIIGEPISFEKKNGKLFVKSQLYADSDMARKVYDLANTLSKNSSSRRMGYSIEGLAVQRDEKNPKRIKKSSVSGLAVCPHPKNHGTEMTVVKGEDFVYETQENSEFLIDITDENGQRITVDRNLEIVKGGEGSGRRGHTTSHKEKKRPEYKITQALVEFLDKHKFSKKEKADHEYISEKIHNYAENIDIEFSDKEAESLAKQYESLSKAMEVGSITGTETHDQSLTQAPLKTESIAGQEGKKKKKKKAIISDVTEMTKADILEYLSDLDISDEEKEEVFELAMDIEKGGEGSKGGKVIGHTKSGKPVYAASDNYKARDYKKFTKQDHQDAADLHIKASMKYKRNDDRGRVHDNAADDHIEMVDSMSYPRMDGKEPKYQYGQDRMIKNKKISKSEVYTSLLSDHNLDIESAKMVYRLAEAIEKKSHN